MTIHTTIAGQTQRYTVAAGQYVLDLPSAQWRAITVSGADYPRDLASATIMASYVCGYEER